MGKHKKTLQIVALSVVLSLAINIFFGRYLSAKISTIPLLNRFKILNPQTPIVINTREEVRINDTNDVLQIYNSAKSKISAVVSQSGNQVKLQGSAVNLTSDGLFLTLKSVIDNLKPENLNIKLDDGTLLQASEIISDTATNLAIIKTAGNNVSVANLGESKKLAPGQKTILLSATLLNYSPGFESVFISSDQRADFSQTKSADFPNRTFSLQIPGLPQDIRIVVNMNGEVVGMIDLGGIISSDVMKDFTGKFLSNGENLKRPAFGFGFRNLSAPEAKLLDLSLGVKVLEVTPGSPAQKAGLQANDIITVVDGTSLSDDMSLEEILQKYKPQDRIKMTVFRNRQSLDLTLTAGVMQ